MASIAGKKDATTQKDKFAPPSKFIALVEYDRETQSMDVTFKSGSKRRYLSISPTAFEAFKASPTQDSFYGRMIRGRAGSTPIVNKNIGTNASKPLDKKTRRNTLDAGIRKARNADARKQPGKRPADYIPG